MKNLNKKLTLVIILLLIIYLISLLMPSIVLNNKEDAQRLINSDNMYNDLLQCIEIYIEDIFNNKYFNVNQKNTISNYKSNSEIDSLKIRMSYLKNEPIVIKKIYQLDNNVYKCYFLKESNSDIILNKYSEISNTDMNYITIRLYKDLEQFKIIDIKC